MWNAAELSEKRKDARVGREFEIALPHELSAEGRLEATRAFAQDLADRYGAAVDFAIHAPHDASDVRNHHAHVMMTTRQVGEDALGDKTYPFLDSHGFSNGDEPPSAPGLNLASPPPTGFGSKPPWRTAVRHRNTYER